ncbi:sensor histidine kinase [Candidatus Leptofilum sp.]|uniref:sensor histidine kinase n=1 Tax=Candidatus Leptofilum sp. TaxID=3241576 RepID=UPI003B5B23D0
MSQQPVPANRTQPMSDRELWIRSVWLWSTVFVLSFVASFLIYYLENGRTEELPLVAVLTIGVIGWHLGAMWRFGRQLNFREDLRLTIPYTVGQVLFWIALVRIDAAFYFGLAGVFSQLFFTLPMLFAAIFSIVVAILIVLLQTVLDGQPFSWTLMLFYTIPTGIGIGMGVWLNAIMRQSQDRKQLAEELQATRHELAQSERRAGVLAERQRLAHEIHDTLAQGFISIIMNLETAEQTLAETNSDAARQIQQAKEAARHNLQQARRVVADLRPESLENHTLPAAIERTVQRWSQRHSIAATMQTTGMPLPLHPDVDVTLLRATQEALANIHKHAQARNVSVTLSYMDDLVLLDVQDDGVGMNGTKPSPFGGGFGLQAMRERAAQFGGELLLESDPDGGTTLVVSIPIT